MADTKSSWNWKKFVEGSLMIAAGVIVASAVISGYNTYVMPKLTAAKTAPPATTA